MQPDRGTVQTTNQIMNAPPNSIYVWVTDDLFYPRKLAEHLNRKDIKFWRFSEYPDRNDERLRGIRVKIILDHAAWQRLRDIRYQELLERKKYGIQRSTSSLFKN